MKKFFIVLGAILAPWALIAYAIYKYVTNNQINRN